MKKLMFALLAGTLLSGACNAEDNLGNMLKWEKESRNSVPHPKKKVPAAEALVRKANALLKGNPTCSQMLQASKLLDKADDLYINAGAFDGDVRTVGRRVSWLEESAKAGACRKVAEKPSLRGRGR